VLLRLKDNGIVSEIPGGFVLNRLHITAQAVEILADLHGELIRRIRSAVNTWKSEVLLVGLFGSAARRDGNSSSDIDILIVSEAQDLKELADQLASQVTTWTGNPAQIVAINRKELKRLRQAKEPIVGHWQSELVIISGDVRILQSSSK
jgi:predicted nucleotidyltransferase